MTPAGLIAMAGAVIALAGIGAPLLSWAFCTRNSPRWVRQWRDVALGMVGVRLLLRENAALGPDAWVVSLIWLDLAVAQAVIFWCNAVNALRGGDRCR